MPEIASLIVASSASLVMGFWIGAAWTETRNGQRSRTSCFEPIGTTEAGRFVAEYLRAPLHGRIIQIPRDECADAPSRGAGQSGQRPALAPYQGPPANSFRFPE